MMHLTIQTLFLLVVSFFLTQSKLPEGFVYIEDIDPTIRISLKYFTSMNFIGERINGYFANRGILTKLAAEALAKAQKKFNAMGYCIIVYDAYRPQRAVDHFMEWIKSDDERNKYMFYPRIRKTDFLDKDYLSDKSKHSGGSTVDMSIIRCDTPHLTISYPIKRNFNGYEVYMMWDNSLDTGSGYDILDEASNVKNDVVTDEHKANRKIIEKIMTEEGFEVLYSEWWHFDFKNDPFPDQYFDFPVE